MKDSLRLYYDTALQKFSFIPNSNSENVFDACERGLHANLEDNFEQDSFRITMRTISTKAPKRRYVYVDIYINGVLLLPLSLSCRKAYIYYHFGKHEIIFQQWGAGQTKQRTAHTIMQKDENINWSILLSQICRICNNYEVWIVQETEQLTVLLENNKKNKYWDIATFIELVRIYEGLVPGIIPVIHTFVDKYCLNAMKNLIDSTAKHKMKIKDMQHKTKCGDIIWNYIKDYLLVQVPKETGS